MRKIVKALALALMLSFGFPAISVAAGTDVTPVQGVRQSDQTASGTLTMTTVNTSVSFSTILNNSNSIAVIITGTWTGSALTVQGSIDNTNWVALPITYQNTGAIIQTGIIPSASNLMFLASSSGMKYVRVISTVAGTGTPTANLVSTAAGFNTVSATVASPGSNPPAAQAVQGITSGTPVAGNITQVASTTLGAPVAAGTSASGNILAVQGVSGGYPAPHNLTQVAGTTIGAPVAAGTSASGNVLAVQGVSGGYPAPHNLTLVNGTTLGSPTAAGTSASGNILAVQGVTNGVAMPHNLTLVNGTSLGSPTAAGTSASGNILAVQGVTNGVAMPHNLTLVNGTALGSPTAAGTAASGNILTVQGNTSGVTLPTKDTFTVAASTMPTLTAGTAATAFTGMPNQSLLVGAQLGTWSELNQSTPISAQNQPYNTLKVSEEFSSLLFDPFDTSDTTNRWNTPITGGTASASVTNGTLTVTATAASSYAEWYSRPSFVAIAPGYLQIASAVKLETTLQTGSHRFWGIGTSPGTPTNTAPLTNAIGFEVNTSGALNATVWANGSEIYTQALTAPTDGAYHRYITVVSTHKIYWFIDTTDGSPLATASFQTPYIQTLPVRIQTVTGTSPSGSPAITMQGIGLGDTGRNNTAISDGTYGFRKATVNTNGGLLAAFDQTTPGTTNGIALNSIGSTTLGSPTAAGTSASGNILGIQGVTGGVAVPVTCSSGCSSVTSGTSTRTNVSVGTSSTSLLAVNASRKQAIFYNSSSTATVYIIFGTGGSTSDYSYALGPGATLELPLTFTGAIGGIVSSGTATVYITELT